MGRPIRFVPAGALVEVTSRTFQGRFLLRPSHELNLIVCGILARALDRYEVEICEFKVLSNHYHFLLVPADARALANFMRYVNTNVSKEAGRLHGWSGKLFAKPFHAALVSHEEAAQVERLRYVLAQGCKEGLVRRPQDWPGAGGLEALLAGKPIRGLWFDRTREHQARAKKIPVSKYDFAEETSFELAPLPAWAHLAPEVYRQRVGELAREIEAETRKRLEESGRSPMGRDRILKQDPRATPADFQPRPAPRFHAFTRRVRLELELAYREFLLAYRAAAEEVKRGNFAAQFPPGCFPTRLPFCRGPSAFPAT